MSARFATVGIISDAPTISLPDSNSITYSYSSPLIEATLLRRYRRFLADVRLVDGTETTVHCPNPGRMTSVCEEGAKIRLIATPDNKMAFRWIQSLTPYGWAGVDTMLPNRIMGKVFRTKPIPGWGKAELVEPEVNVVDSRFDFRLMFNKHFRLVEVKSVTWFDETTNQFLFPDAPSVRAVKHLNTLIQQKQHGMDCSIVYAVQHPAHGKVCAAHELDPLYAETVDRAKNAGVEFRAFYLQALPDCVVWTGEECEV